MRQDLKFRWQPAITAEALSYCFFAQLPSLHTHTSLPLHIRHEFYTGGSDTGLHQHEDFYVLYVVQGGRGIHLINTYPHGIARGDVYLLTPGTRHAYRNYAELRIDAFYFQLHLFSQEELRALHSLAGFWRILIEPDAGDTPHKDAQRLHLPPERHSTIETMLAELHTEFRTPSEEATILTHHQFFRLLIQLVRWHTILPSQKLTGSTVSEQIQQHKADMADVLRFCEEHFAEKLTVPQLARLMFLSPGRFTELFSREIGMTPAAYIRYLRLERAQTLLRTTSQSSTSIAHQVGFRDGAQLSRTFQTTFHLTPSAYRLLSL